MQVAGSREHAAELVEPYVREAAPDRKHGAVLPARADLAEKDGPVAIAKTDAAHAATS